jgi:1-acyl-sn-glycerol-3-phosphate acyltransferase
VVANHAHVLDPFFLILGFPRWVTFVAKEELFRSRLARPWLHWAGSLPLERDGKVRQKQQLLSSAKNALERGLVLAIFPEGTRSEDGKLRKGKPGPAVIASKADAPVLPVGIAGTDKIHGISWLWKRPHVVVKIGRSFKLPPTNNRISKSQMQLLTTQVMEEIAALLPPEYQGAYERREDSES